MGMPSIGASFAQSNATKSGGQVIFQPSHAMGYGRVSNTNSTDWAEETSAEATAKTDMGGGLLGGGGGGGDSGGGFGLGGFISGIASTASGLLGGKKQTNATNAANGNPGFAPPQYASGPSRGLIIGLAVAGLAVVGLIIWLVTKD